MSVNETCLIKCDVLAEQQEDTKFGVSGSFTVVMYVRLSQGFARSKRDAKSRCTGWPDCTRERPNLPPVPASEDT